MLFRSTIGPLRSAHIHQKVAIYLNGTRVNLALPQYQSRDLYARFELGDGVTLHLHATGITLRYILSTLGMLGKTSLVVAVNGSRLDAWVDYKPKDLDVILITDRADLADAEWIEFWNQPWQLNRGPG